VSFDVLAQKAIVQTRQFYRQASINSIGAYFGQQAASPAPSISKFTPKKVRNDSFNIPDASPKQLYRRFNRQSSITSQREDRQYFR